MRRSMIAAWRCLLAASSLWAWGAYAQEPVPEGMARIIVEVDTMPSSTLGVHMLLDSKAESFGGAYSEYSLPSDVTSSSNWRGREAFYDTNFDCRIPAEASVSDSIPTGLLNGQADTLDIPAGTYDYILVYFWSGSYMGYVNGDSERAADDAVFEAGHSYKFHINASSMLTYWPPYGISVTEAVLPEWGHDLGKDDEVAVKVVNMGLETIHSFEAGYSVNGADTVFEKVECDLPSGDTMVYVFTQNPDFSDFGLLDIEFLVRMEGDDDASDNALSATLYHPAVRSIPFHDDFESADSLNHWQTEDLSGNDHSGDWRQSMNTGKGALETNGFLNSTCYSTPAALYLISDPFRIEAGIQHASFYYTGGSVSSPEQIELFYGYSSDISTMTRAGGVSSIFTPVMYGPPQLQSFGWEMAVFNIDFKQDSVYYFAIGLTTEGSGSHSVYIDEFGIDTGRYNILPDFELVSLVLPPSACGMGVDSVGAVVRNAGRAPMAGFSMECQVKGLDTIYFETQDSVQVGEMRTFWFDEKVDFSEERAYELLVTGTCPKQDIYDNDTLETIVYHYAPVAEFPYLADFTDSEGDARNEWYADTADKWSYDSENRWTASLNAGMIHSRCMELQEGVYRIALRYKAGYGESYYQMYDNFRVGIQAVGDTAKICVLDRKQQNTNTETISFDTVFEVTQAGTYTFYVDPYDAPYLALAGFGVEEAFYNDIRLEEFASATLLPVMPVSQIHTTHVFSASIRNRGWNVPQNPRLVLSAGDAEGMETAISDSIPFALPMAEVGAVLEVKAEALSDSVDEYPDDNSLSIRVSVSDSVMATDQAVIGHPVEGYFVSAPVGNLYTIMVPDTLTSITFSFAGTDAADSMSFCLYAVHIDSNKQMILGDTLYEHRFRMPKDAGLTTLALPSLPLMPGTYFAALVNARANSGYMTDSAEDGFFYSAAYTGVLDKEEGRGNMILRLNFGPERSPYALADLAVYQISGPEDSTRMSATEEITAQVVNYSDAAVSDVDVIWNVDGEERMETVDIAGATAVTLVQTVDFSALGSHSVTVEVIWPNDPDTTNNVMRKDFMCMERSGNEEMETPEVKVYPNPASSEVHVHSTLALTRIELLDAKGWIRCMWNGASCRVKMEVDGLPAGMYLMRMETEKGVVIKKIVVND